MEIVAAQPRARTRRKSPPQCRRSPAAASRFDDWRQRRAFTACERVQVLLCRLLLMCRRCGPRTPWTRLDVRRVGGMVRLPVAEGIRILAHIMDAMILVHALLSPHRGRR